MIRAFVLRKILRLIPALAEKRAVLAGARSGVKYAHAGLRPGREFPDEQVTIVLIELENVVKQWQFAGRLVMMVNDIKIRECETAG